MSKFHRVWAESIDGFVFTEAAFETLQGQLESSDSKEISSVEIQPEERIYDVADLPELGYEGMTQQSDEFDGWTDEDFNEADLDLGFDETDNEFND